jgi:hypothetical protein
MPGHHGYVQQAGDEDYLDFEDAVGSAGATDDGVEDMSLGTQLQEEMDEQVGAQGAGHRGQGTGGRAQERAYLDDST